MNTLLAFQYFEHATPVTSLAAAGFNPDGTIDRAPTAEGFVDTINVNALSLANGGDGEGYGARYTTTLTIEEGGIYTFATNSDDGSMLTVDGEAVVINDGVHGMVGKTGFVDLAPGTYEIGVSYFEWRWGDALEVYLAGADTGGQMISLTEANISAVEEEEEETGPLADLDITRVRIGDDDLAVGQDLFVSVKVANIGEADANDASVSLYWSATDSFDMETATLLTVEGDGKLKDGETDVNNIRVRYEDLAELGDGYIFAHADGRGVVAESDEDNNGADGVAITIAQPVAIENDLNLSNFKAVDTSLKLDQDMELRVNVNNDGNGDTHGVRTSYYWSEDNVFDAETDVLVANTNHGKIYAGETEGGERTTIDYDDLAELGDGFIFAIVDEKDVVEEANEDNNMTGPIEFTIEELGTDLQTNLWLSNSRLIDRTLAEGQDLEIEFDVVNGGPVDARGVVTTAYWSPTREIDEETLVALETEGTGLLNPRDRENDEEMRIRYEELEELGEGYIVLIVNADGSINESNMDNNMSGVMSYDLL